MQEYLIYEGAAPCGSLRMEEQGLYTRFSALFGARRGQLYSLMLAGDAGEALLGVPEWRDGCYALERTMARRIWQVVGKVQCARLYLRQGEEKRTEKQEEAEEAWIRLDRPEYFFKTLSPQLAQRRDCYWRPGEKGRFLAVPMEAGKLFLLPRYFCFARVEQIWGQNFAVFFFDEGERPRVF